MTLIALASLTNVALALSLDPQLPNNLASLVILGGAVRTMGNVNPVAEANIYHDCESADLVLGADAPVRGERLVAPRLCLLSLRSWRQGRRSLVCL